MTHNKGKLCFLYIIRITYNCCDEKQQRGIHTIYKKTNEAKISSFYRLFALEEVAKVLRREIVPIGEADEEEVDFRTGGHLLEHGDELVAIDPTSIGRRFHRIEFLCLFIF